MSLCIGDIFLVFWVRFPLPPLSLDPCPLQPLGRGACGERCRVVPSFGWWLVGWLGGGVVNLLCSPGWLNGCTWGGVGVGWGGLNVACTWIVARVQELLYVVG